MSLKKTIPVEDDDIDRAIEKAEKIFYENELTEEYLNARNIEISENVEIMSLAKTLAWLFFERYGLDLKKEEIEETFYRIYKKDEEHSFIFNELIKELNERYNISFENIKI